MHIAGLDYSTHALDIVLIDFDTAKPLRPFTYQLEGQDAFDRARNTSHHAWKGAAWDGVLAVGIEEPAGHQRHQLTRIQGAILAHIPARMLVKPWYPSEWRKAVGLPGNATKAAVLERANELGLQTDRQDTADAYCIALATLKAITHQKAA